MPLLRHAGQVGVTSFHQLISKLMHAIPKFPALLLLLSALFLPACRKDMQPLLPASGEAAIRSSQKAAPDPLTVPFARGHFQARQRAVQARTSGAPQDSLQLLMGQIELLWDFADTVLYRDTVPLLLVPVATAEAVEPGRQAAMLFFIDSSGYMDSRLLFILADPEYTPPVGGFSDYFTGYLLQVSWDGALSGSFRLQNGFLSAERPHRPAHAADALRRRQRAGAVHLQLRRIFDLHLVVFG